MRFKWIALLLLLTLAAFPALAQETSSTVTFNGISFAFDTAFATNVNIVQLVGADETTFPPEAAHTRFYLYNGFPNVPQGFFDQGAVVTVYRTSDLAGNAEAQARFQQLQTLLNGRPDLAQFMTYSDNLNDVTLPFLPAVAAGQIVRARAQYLETPAVRGISYVAAYRQDVGPLTGGELFYTFQGVSLDGQYYVSVLLNFDTPLFPAEPAPIDPATFDMAEHVNQAIGQLNEAGTDAFTPSLASLDSIVQTMAFLAVQPPGAAPEATPPVTNTDPTLGGLAGTWTLVSYGAVDAPAAALPDVPVTLAFAESGISGSAGCNSFGGAFVYEANTLAFSDVVTTLMACDQPVMDQESTFLGALQTASNFQIVNDQLQIAYDGGVLTFIRSA